MTAGGTPSTINQSKPGTHLFYNPSCSWQLTLRRTATRNSLQQIQYGRHGFARARGQGVWVL